MPSSATVTGVTGPAKVVTSLALTGVTRLDVLTAPKSVITVYCDQGIKYFDMNGTTTFTISPSTGTLTITISQ